MTKTKVIRLGETESGEAVKLDLEELIDTRMVVAANSGGGKSYFMRVVVERAASTIPFIVLDWEGEFWTLREKLDFLLVGADGEVPATTGSAKLLARKIVERGVSAVIDLYEMRPSARQDYASIFLSSLINLPRSLWRPYLVFIDEAHKLCPEKGEGSATSTEAVIDLMSMGGKRGLCGILATQRFSKINNNALAEANNILIGRTFLDNDQKRAAKYLGIPPSKQTTLQDIEQGYFHTFGPAFEHRGVQFFHADKAETTHLRGVARRKMLPPEPSKSIQHILGEFDDLPQQALEEARTLEEANERLHYLQRELEQLKKDAPTVPVEKVVEKVETVEVAIIKPDQVKQLEEIATFMAGLPEEISDATTALHEKLQEISRIQMEARKGAGEIYAQVKSVLASIEDSNGHKAVHTSAAPANVPVMAKAERRQAPPPALNDAVVPVEGVGKGEMIVLRAIAMYGDDGVTRDQLSVLTGYKKSSRNTYVSRLVASGMVEAKGASLIATFDGVKALGKNFRPLPTGKELQQYWIERLPGGEREIFLEVIKAWPNPITREAISAKTDYKKSSRNTYLSRLSARKLVVNVGAGAVKASPQLFT